MLGSIRNGFNCAAVNIFSTLKYAVTHPLQAVTAVLFASTLPSIYATQEAINSREMCSRWLGKRTCVPLFNEIAERTIGCTWASGLDEVVLEGIPLNPVVLQRRPKWAYDGWRQCMLHTDERLAEEGDAYGAYELWYYRAEILHALRQIEEGLGESLTQAAESYSTAHYWLHGAPNDFSMIRDNLNAGRLKRLLFVQEHLTRMQALVEGNPDAKEMLIWEKGKKYFDYTSSVDCLNLAFLSYENGDCPQVEKLLQLIENLAMHDIINLDQHIEMATVYKEGTFMSGNGPFFFATTECTSINALTARSALRLLHDRMENQKNR